MSKRFSKYIVSFDYFDKSLIVVSATTGSISIATLIGAPIGIASGSFSHQTLFKATKKRTRKSIIKLLC